MEFRLSPEAYVRDLYRTVLRRDASEPDIAHWAAMVRQTGDPTMVLEAFMGTEEYAVMIKSVGDMVSVKYEPGQDLQRCGIFVPTRDSGNYVGVFLDRLRSLGIEPLYIVDGRSADDTIDILRARGARMEIVQPAGAFGVTELVEAAAATLHQDWIMRLDDDELPTRKLIDFVAGMTSDRSSDAGVGQFTREWCTARSGSPYFFRSWARWDGSAVYDLQRRLFRRSDLSFDHQIHTAGITSSAKVTTAPEGCFVVHFDLYIKTVNQRLAKIRRYEVIEPGSAWTYADLYLPEVYSDEAYCLHQRGLLEFAPFVKLLPSLGEIQFPGLSDSEVESVAAQCPAQGLRRRSAAT